LRPGSQSVYLAVSANILYGYENEACVKIADGRSSLTPNERAFLASQLPIERVGKMIMIYRLGADFLRTEEHRGGQGG
jgi:hypothetical protein